MTLTLYFKEEVKVGEEAIGGKDLTSRRVTYMETKGQEALWCVQEPSPDMFRMDGGRVSVRQCSTE